MISMYKLFNIKKISIFIFLFIGSINTTENAKNIQSKEEIKNPYSIDKKILSKFENKNLVEALVIGSGPGGLTAAFCLSMEGHSVLCAEGETPGGQWMKTKHTIMNWPGIIGKTGPEILKNLKDQALKFGAGFINQDVVNIDFSEWPYKATLKNGIEVYAMGIFIATGSSPRALNIPGEKKHLGKGVINGNSSYDASSYKDKVIAIVGEGRSVIEKALELVNYASEILIFIKKDYKNASKQIEESTEKNPKIKILYDSEIKEIKGDSGKIAKIIYREKEENKEKEVSGVFVFIGSGPNNQLVKDVLNLDENEKITCLDSSQKTKVPFLYALGDIQNSEYHGAPVSSAQGMFAAINFDEDIKSTGMESDYLTKYKKSFLDINNIDSVFRDQLKTTEKEK